MKLWIAILLCVSTSAVATETATGTSRKTAYQQGYDKGYEKGYAACDSFFWYTMEYNLCKSRMPTTLPFLDRPHFTFGCQAGVAVGRKTCIADLAKKTAENTHDTQPAHPSPTSVDNSVLTE